MLLYKWDCNLYLMKIDNMIRKLLFIFFLANTFISLGQNLNSYKYVLVPSYFDFLKAEDQYQVNALTKFLFNKYGFDAYLTNDELPADLKLRACDVLKADVESTGSFLTTKLTVVLRDCQDEVVFFSEKGRSKEKSFKKSYHQALRQAFLSLKELNYTYIPATTEDIQVTQSDEIETNSTTTQQLSDSTPNSKSKKIIAQSEQAEKVVADQIKDNEELFFKSDNSSYSLRGSINLFNLYDGDNQIGTAQISSDGKYLVQSSQFYGIGNIEENIFVIERTIKGVNELVKMVFTRQ